ncbi:hypothetical protein Trydic_g7571 [Trypoxylus dichotomus]
MVKTKDLSVEMRPLINGYPRTDKSKRQITREFNISRQTTLAEDCIIIRISKGNRWKTALQITPDMNEIRRKPISMTAVKRRLGKAGFQGRLAIRKPLLK